MGASHLTGPLTSVNGFIGPITGAVTATDVSAATVEATTSATVGGGTALTKILKGSASVTVAALTAGSEADVTITGTSSVAGDIVVVTPPNAAAETGLGVALAWVPTAGSITIRMSNFSGSSLTGSTSSWTYLLIRS
jgi:hypothetical protein